MTNWKLFRKRGLSIYSSFSKHHPVEQQDTSAFQMVLVMVSITFLHPLWDFKEKALLTSARGYYLHRPSPTLIKLLKEFNFTFIPGTWTLLGYGAHLSGFRLSLPGFYIVFGAELGINCYKHQVVYGICSKSCLLWGLGGLGRSKSNCDERCIRDYFSGSWRAMCFQVCCSERTSWI